MKKLHVLSVIIIHLENIAAYIGEHQMEFLIQILEMEIYLWLIPMLHTTV